MKLKMIIRVFSISFLINLIWEFSQKPLYEVVLPEANHSWLCVKGAFFDASFTLTLFLLISRISKNFFWFRTRIASYAWLIISMSVITSFLIEKNALQKKWFYIEDMPLLFGVGILPLIQLALMSLLTFFLLSFISSEENKPR